MIFYIEITPRVWTHFTDLNPVYSHFQVKVTSPTELAKLFPLYEAETPEKEDQKKEEK